MFDVHGVSVVVSEFQFQWLLGEWKLNIAPIHKIVLAFYAYTWVKVVKKEMTFFVELNFYSKLYSNFVVL